MKKLFLVALAAGLFVACGNKSNEEAVVDTPAVVEEEVVAEVVDTPDVAEEPVVAEETAKTQTPAKKENKTVKETAKEVGENVAKEAINKGGEEAVKNIKGTSSKGNR